MSNDSNPSSIDSIRIGEAIARIEISRPSEQPSNNGAITPGDDADAAAARAKATIPPGAFTKPIGV